MSQPRPRTRMRIGCAVLITGLVQAAVGVAADPVRPRRPSGSTQRPRGRDRGGLGLVTISPTSSLGHGTFDARVIVNIHDAAPSTSWTVTRAGDGLPDGVCHSIVVGTVAQLETSAGGAGAVEFERTGALSDFDLTVTVTGADGSVLQSGCMTIHLK